MQRWPKRSGAVPPAPGRARRCQRKAFAAARQRAVVSCFSLVRIDGRRRIVLGEFERSGENALASVVLLDRDRVLFADYPATFRADGQDLWRVDDGGKLSPAGFQVVFVAQDGQQCGLALSWAGTEGRSLAVFLSGSGSALDRVIDDYWYQMPQQSPPLDRLWRDFETESYLHRLID
jgi:hypothetical protein